VIIEAGEVPNSVLDVLTVAVPDYDPSASWNREGWRRALAAALTEWEKKRPRDLVPPAAGHDCAWVTVGVQHRDMVFGVKQTDALQRCDGCGDVRTQVLTGTWTLDQLRA
jgi:hypothetical protein